MLKQAILYKLLTNTSSLLLGTTAIGSPIAVGVHFNDTKLNPKRVYNPLEESGLDYKVDRNMNPFELESASENKFALLDEFCTKTNYTSHKNYHVLDWSDLSTTTAEGLSSWLSQINNYLSDDENYKVEITNKSPADDMYKGQEINFYLNNDFSAKQKADMQLDWETSQFGFFTKTIFQRWMVQNLPYLVYPLMIHHGDVESYSNDIIWTSLTGSDFYTNWSDKKDKNKMHAPHDFNFNLQANVLQKELPGYEGTEQAPGSKFSARMYYYDFFSEDPYTTKPSSEWETKTFNSLSDLISFQSAPPTTFDSTVYLPSIDDNTRWFAFDSTQMIKEPKYTSFYNIFEKCIDDHNFKNDRSKIFNQLNKDDNGLIAPSIVSPGSYACAYIPEINSKDTTADAKSIELPESVSQTFPSEYASDNVNFIDYYNISNQNGLSCDIFLDDSNKLVYQFKSGEHIVNTITKVVDSNFRDFFNLCLSSMGTSNNVYNSTSTDNYKNSYSSMRSSDNNKIINLKSTIGANGQNDVSVPFVQNPDGVIGGANTISAQSVGISFSPSDKSISVINPDGSTTLQKGLNLGFISNKTSLKATSTGNTNKMLCSLDYLLAVDPSSTNFYENIQDYSQPVNPVKVRLNPYYIQAAANAYSSYNFWLRFYKDHDWSSFGSSKDLAQMVFRDLIMRGFIKTEKQANAIFSNLVDKHIQIATLVPAEWFTHYKSLGKKELPYLSSYGTIQNGLMSANQNFVWESSSFQVSRPGIWADKNGKIYEKERPVVSQSSWAPFCWQYGISPQTFSFLKSIPKDYTFTIPYAFIQPTNNTETPSKNWNKGNVSGAVIQEEDLTLTWEELLNGRYFEFKWPKSLIEDDWNNISVMIGANNSSVTNLQGIHAEMKGSSKKITTHDNTTVELSIPSFSGIKLATISQNNHYDATNSSQTPFDFNPIQEYSTLSGRKRLLKDNDTINYIAPTSAHNVIALHKSEAQLALEECNNLSSNTYIVSKINSTKAQYSKYLDNYIKIDSDGTHGIIMNFSNWRDSISNVTNVSKYYSSTQTLISGTREDKKTWLMEGVAPEDWFDDSYLVSYNNYTTYKWAFHPSGLWSYNMQFYQDPDQTYENESEWDDLHQSLNLDYSLWGRPTIEPITRNSFVPQELITGYDIEIPIKNPETGVIEWITYHVDGWKDKYAKAGYTASPVFYTNNASHELVFKVTYNDLKFDNAAFPGEKIVPVQYVYIHDCFYNFGLTQIDSPAKSINDFYDTNKQYGDFAPEVLDHWESDSNLTYHDKSEEYTEEEIKKNNAAEYSTHDILNILSPNEIINFYKSTSTNGIYKCNVKYSDFVKLYKNGWIYIEPIKLKNEDHIITFKIHYDSDILVDESFEKSGTLNPNYQVIMYKNQKIKIPDLSKLSTLSTTDISIKDFRAVGTEWSLVKGKNTMTPLVIGLIVCCCVVPVLIVVTGILLKRTRTKYKRIK